MSLRELGKTGVKISAIGLGCMGMSDFYGSADEQGNINVLNRAIDLGSTFWDTSDIYGNGANEILLSKVLKDKRDKVFLCTKFGGLRDSNGAFLGVSGKPEYVRQACERSLKRLGVDYIDLYYQHRVTIVAYSPLGRGFLTGKYKSIDDFEPDDVRRMLPRFQGENFDKNLVIVRKFEEFANKKGVTPSQLCLAWVLAQGDNIVAIPGTRKIKYLEENLEGIKIHLTPEELSEIRQIINSIEIIGTRYQEEHMKEVNI
ncbi:oxidoreductase [Rhizophagus irregularis]|uniref:Oxidoreductase n=1 Tax=Rhizophagus irregularis TaxID=588596 RepID=A0A2N0RAI6_9GLOM|nr:oxidoreductase [Rhizophagus irregularis]